MTSAADDAVSVSILVALDPSAAFRVFTEEVDTWWRRGPQYRFLAPWSGTLRIEPGVGGGLVELDGSGNESWRIGEVLVWDPGRRLVFSWRLPSFTEAQSTEVEVLFESARGGTRITLRHRGLDALPPEHPARHGRQGPDFLDWIGAFWLRLLAHLRVHAASEN